MCRCLCYKKGLNVSTEASPCSRCKIEVVYFKESLRGAVELLSIQILNEESGIVNEADVKDASKVLMFQVDGFGPRWKKLF